MLKNSIVLTKKWLIYYPMMLVQVREATSHRRQQLELPHWRLEELGEKKMK
jgi:hypothetical protein